MNSRDALELYKKVRKLADEAAERALEARAEGKHSDIELYTGKQAGLLAVLHILVDDYGVNVKVAEYDLAREYDAREHAVLTPADRDEFGHGLGDVDAGGE